MLCTLCRKSYFMKHPHLHVNPSLDYSICKHSESYFSQDDKPNQLLNAIIACTFLKFLFLSLDKLSFL